MTSRYKVGYYLKGTHHWLKSFAWIYQVFRYIRFGKKQDEAECRLVEMFVEVKKEFNC